MRDRMTQLALAPVLLAQAAWVILRAQQLPEATGPRAGVQGQGRDLRLLVLGDSSAAGVGAATQDQALVGQLAAQLALRHRVSWQLEARTGWTTKQALTRLRSIAPAQFDVAVTALGVNDATRLKPIAAWIDHGRRMRATLRQHFGVQRFYVSGLPPLGKFPLLPEPLAYVLGRHAENMMAAQHNALQQEPDVVLVGFDQPFDAQVMASDGFHPGPLVYAAWAQALAHRIEIDFAE